MLSVIVSFMLWNIMICLVYEMYKIYFEFFIFREKINFVYFIVNILIVLILYKCIIIY